MELFKPIGRQFRKPWYNKRKGKVLTKNPLVKKFKNWHYVYNAIGDIISAGILVGKQNGIAKFHSRYAVGPRYVKVDDYMFKLSTGKTFTEYSRIKCGLLKKYRDGKHVKVDDYVRIIGSKQPGMYRIHNLQHYGPFGHYHYPMATLTDINGIAISPPYEMYDLKLITDQNQIVQYLLET